MCSTVVEQDTESDCLHVETHWRHILPIHDGCYTSHIHTYKRQHVQTVFSFPDNGCILTPSTGLRAGAPAGIAGGNPLPSLPPAGTQTCPPMPH